MKSKKGLPSEKQLDEAVYEYLGKKMDGLEDQIEDERLKDLLVQINKLKIDHPETTSTCLENQLRLFATGFILRSIKRLLQTARFCN